MPNRIIRDSILTSPTIAPLSAEEERHFYRLMLLADDYGCLQLLADVIKGSAYPLAGDKITRDDVERWTLCLAKNDIIHLYEFGGRQYGHFVKWGKYQQIRAKRSKHPVPECITKHNPHLVTETIIVCKQLIAIDSYSTRNPNPNPNPSPLSPFANAQGDVPPFQGETAQGVLVPQKIAAPVKTKKTKMMQRRTEPPPTLMPEDEQWLVSRYSDIFTEDEMHTYFAAAADGFATQWAKGARSDLRAYTDNWILKDAKPLRVRKERANGITRGHPSANTPTGAELAESWRIPEPASKPGDRPGMPKV